MYILLNREALTINYKNSLPVSLCNVAWIELQTQAYSIVPCDVSAFRGLTEMELKILYRNTVGKDSALQGLNPHLEVLTNLIINMPESNIDYIESEIQAACIAEGQKGFYKYVWGAKTPALIQNLFNNGYNASPNFELEDQASKGHWPLVLASYKEKIKTELVATTANSAVITPAIKTAQVKTHQAIKEPGAGTTSGKVWALADSVRSHFESVNQGADIAGIKRAVVDTLLAQGINKSTITTQLSHWQKNRLAV
jgi:hypothetical protein